MPVVSSSSGVLTLDFFEKSEFGTNSPQWEVSEFIGRIGELSFSELYSFIYYFLLHEIT